VARGDPVRYAGGVTTTEDALAIRTATAEDFERVHDLMDAAFLEASTGPSLARERLVFEPERDLFICDGDLVVANAAAYTRELSVPGGVLPTAHVTMVAVRATYRRRGLLRRLMRQQLSEIHSAGREPLAALWASEGGIYQRFGYGTGTLRLAFDADRQHVRLLPRAGHHGGRLRESSPDTARPQLMEVYERVRRDRPGWSSRGARWWDHRLHDPAEDRGGHMARSAVLYEGPDGTDGYALWRVKQDWDATGSKSVVEVHELVAATPAAYVELWRFLLSVDLTRYVRFWAGSWDEPLLHLVADPRALGGRHQEALWLRIVDVPTALAARRYSAPIDVVLEVADDLLPANAGRWRLHADGGSTTCRRTDATPDLRLDVADLAASYLGAVSLGTLAAAGRVEELRSGTLAPVALAFGWPRPPSAIEGF
jgi:predicted acetyltransferase